MKRLITLRFSSIKKRLKNLLSVAIFIGMALPVFSQTTYTFSTAGNWNVAANWSGGAVPPDPLPVGDFIVIDADCTLEEAKTIQGTLTVNASRTWTIYHATNTFLLSNNGTINNSGTITPREQFVNNSGGAFTNLSGGSFTFASGGYMDNFGTFTNNGAATFGSVWTNKSGSTFINNNGFFITSGFATFANQAGATANLNNGSNMNTQCNLNNTGVLNLNPGGKLTLLKDPAVLPGGTFNWTGTLAINANFYVYNGQTFTVPAGATFELDNGLSYLLVYSGGILMNNGTVTAKGTLENKGTTTGTGAFNINDTYGQIFNASGGSFICNGTLTVNSTQYGLRNVAGSTFTNNGTINDNGFFTNSGTFSNVGTLNLNTGGTFEMNTNPAVLPGGTFNWNAGTLKVGTNGVMTIANTFTVPSGRNLLASSTAAFTVSASGQLVVNGSANFFAPLVNNGIVTNSNVLKIYSPSSSLTNNGTLSNSSVLFLEKTFTNNGTFNQTDGHVDFCYSNAAFPAGTFNWTGGILNIGDPNGNYNGTMTFASPITIPANRVLKVNPSGSLTNSSTLTIGSGGKLETPVYNFLNNGTLINNGIFNTIGSTSNYFYTSGTLKGGGTNTGCQYYSELTGNVSPGASPGCYSFSSGFWNLATLTIEINGPTPCSQHDQVQVTGTMYRGGTLAINFGFTPSVGQSFQVATATGGFAYNFASVTVTPSNIVVSEVLGLVTVTAILPIELTDFKAKTLEKSVRLNWKTASETNNRGFQIERSPDGNSWAEIGFVNGQGTTSEPTDYFFDDENPLPGLNFYRLVQLDFDGKTSLSPVVSIKMEGKTGLVHFTNPVSNSLELLFSKTDESACDFSFFDLQGRLLFEKTTDQPVEKLDLNGLPGGQFLLRCECGGQAETHRLVKAN